MKFIITDSKTPKEKREIRSKGLFCYDLRLSDDGDRIETIEKNVIDTLTGLSADKLRNINGTNNVQNIAVLYEINKYNREERGKI